MNFYFLNQFVIIVRDDETIIVDEYLNHQTQLVYDYDFHLLMLYIEIEVYLFFLSLQNLFI
jgi:hypothetical protein